MEKIKLKKIRLRNNQILTTANQYDDATHLDKKGLILDAKVVKGTIKLHQTVLAKGPMVRDVEVGDIVMINPLMYLKRELREQRDDLKYDINEVHVKESYGPEFEFPMIVVNDEPCLMLSDHDVEYIIEEADNL